ncbi:hypothetical protein SH601_05385 [Gracilibacillus sp. S3-1-1]|uniref:Uncharacterized protein n=1 Tax=Gracilibacillus pellucidus TaxID=3095368 RepID=A0ACC6M3V2_9BACI|nr:hypothetical protein [Gracilibacillus sp. S3-1-1]MDX8045417.1 hypothetical protein [Gracilibacillus sp. S3-1-1]
MAIILAYCQLHIKTLLKEKVTLIWSIMIPSLFLLLNVNLDSIHSIDDIRFFWVIIIFMTFVYGIGMHAIKLRNYSTLKTYFSIADTRVRFLLPCLITQLVTIIISFTVFNIIVCLIFPFSIVDVLHLSLKMLLLSIPFGFLSFSFVLLRKVKYETLSGIMGIITFILLFTMSFKLPLGLIHPLVYIANLIYIESFQQIVIYLLIALLCLLIGLFSARTFTAFSEERR